MNASASSSGDRHQPIGSALLHIQTWLTAHDDAFTRWCDESHHFEALRAPGFLACRRFELVPGYAYAAPDGAGYLTVYQLDDEHALESDAHQAIVAAMTPAPPGVMDALTHTSTIYRERFPIGGWMTPEGAVESGNEPIGSAILHVMMDVEPEWDDELNAWYAEEHLPRLLAVPGMLAGRRFVDAHWATSPSRHGAGSPSRHGAGSPSSHGGGSAGGHHQYMATYELVDAGVVSTPEYAEAAAMTPRTEALAPHLSFFSQIYREVFNATPA